MDDSALQHMLELIGSSTLQRQACGKANSIDSYQPPSTIRAADWPGLDDAEYGLSLGVRPCRASREHLEAKLFSAAH